MKRSSLLAVVLTTLIGASSCKSLPDVPANQCGNGVVEPDLGEHCDGVASKKGPNGEATVCGAPGGEGACRYIPSEGGVCPAGYRSTSEGICREPSGKFVRLASIDVTATGVVPIDLGGDGKVELGITGLSSIHFYDFASGQARNLSTVPALVPTNLAPTVADISGDGLDDLVLPTDAGFSGYLGQADGSLSPLVSSNITPGTNNFRVFNVQADPSTEDFELLTVLRVDDSGRGYFVANGTQYPNGGFPLQSAQPFQGLALGRVDISENACDEILLHDFADPAVGADASVLVINTCPIPTDPARQYRPFRSLPAGYRMIRLERDNGSPPAIDAGFHRLDVDGDGRQDIVVQAARGQGAACRTSLFVLHGGGIEEEFTELAADGLTNLDALRCDAPITALGYFDRDDQLDATVGDSLVLTKLGSRIEVGTGPTIAGDLNGDGVSDLAIGIPFVGVVTFMGGSDVPLANFYETRGEVRYLDITDFDGDRVGDLVLGELNVAAFQSTPCRSRGYAEILYGRLLALPEAPTFVGTVPEIVQLFAGRLSDDESFDAFGDVAIVSRCADVASGALLQGNAGRDTLSQVQLPSPLMAGDERLVSLAGLSVGDVFLDTPGSGGAPSPGKDGLPDVLAYATLAEPVVDDNDTTAAPVITGIAVWALPGIGDGVFRNKTPLVANVDFLQSFQEGRLEGAASSILSSVGGASERMFVWISGRNCDLTGCIGRWETFYADPAAAATNAAVTTIGGGTPPDTTTAGFGTPRLSEVVTRPDGAPEIFVADPSWGVYRIHTDLGSLGVDSLDALASDTGSPLRDFAVVDAGVPRTLLVSESTLFTFDPDANTVTPVEGFEEPLGPAVHLARGDYDGDGLEDIAIVTLTRVQVFRQLSKDDEPRDVVLSLAAKK